MLMSRAKQRMFNLYVIVAGLLVCCLLLVAHVALTDKHAKDMRQVSDQLAAIQWPVENDIKSHRTPKD